MGLREANCQVKAVSYSILRPPSNIDTTCTSKKTAWFGHAISAVKERMDALEGELKMRK